MADKKYPYDIWYDDEPNYYGDCVDGDCAYEDCEKEITAISKTKLKISISYEYNSKNNIDFTGTHKQCLAAAKGKQDESLIKEIIKEAKEYAKN